MGAPAPITLEMSFTCARSRQAGTLVAMVDEAALLQISRHGEGEHVALVLLDRPAALNAISTEFSRQITACMRGLAADPGVRAVVLASSSARAFCVGADLKERHAMTDDELLAHRVISQQAYRSVLSLPMAAIAAVEGHALGGGLELALSCDLIIAGAHVTAALPEVSVGLIPGGGGTQLLTRRVGWSRAASMIMTAVKVDGPQAQSLGLVDELVAAGEATQRALALACQISSHSPNAVRHAKAAMREGADRSLSDGLEREDVHWHAAAQSADRQEGIAAFNEKRMPRWHADGKEK